MTPNYRPPPPACIPASAASHATGNRVLNADPRAPLRVAPRSRQMIGTTELPGADSGDRDRSPAHARPRRGGARGDEAFSGLWPGDFGGNMDAREVRAGTTVYLPIFHDGAYFYFGDGHARQGNGELAGTGLETTMDVVLRIDVVKGKTIGWPRLEDDRYIMVAGSARPLMDAFRIAHVELIEWLEQDYGFDRWDAYVLLGQVAESYDRQRRRSVLHDRGEVPEEVLAEGVGAGVGREQETTAGGQRRRQRQGANGRG